jgi:mannitol-1-phosphate 5-dehydrogenase
MVRRGEGLDLIGEADASAFIDQSAWRGGPPELAGLKFIEGLTPYYKRKLYTNNAGHAALAYLGALEGCRFLTEALENGEIHSVLIDLLEVAAEALHLEYGLARADLQAHLADLVRYRYANRELADPVARVARQPLRKLGPDERLVGLLHLLQKHRLAITPVCRVIGAALHYFDPSDEECLRLREMIAEGGADQVLHDVCGLSPEDSAFEQALEFYNCLIPKRTTVKNQ